MKDHFSYFLKCFVLLASTLAAHEAAASTVRLPGHVPAQAVAQATLMEHLDSSANVPLTFVLPLRNKEALEALVQKIYDPNDQEYYGKYLTPEEFAEQFAPTQEDYDAVIAYVNSLGMTVANMHPNRTLLNVSALTADVEKAFNLSLHQYQMPQGRAFYAPDNDPEVPESIASIIHGIVGLDNQAVRHTYNRQKQMSSPDTSKSYPSGPGGGYAPSDLLTAYNLTGVTTTGSGQIVALFELGSYQASDINEYTKYFGLPAPKLKNILVDGGSTSGIDPEVTLDIELALALAPQSQIYVYEGPNSDQGVLDTYNRIATDNLAKQVSTSWGMGENLASVQYLQAENAIFLQMAAHGQTIYAAAGDSGAYDDYPTTTLMVDDPASQPYVVGVGGTRLTVNPNSGAYASELVWDNGLGNGAGGGGVSTVWPLPSWQTNVSTVFSKTHRNVPDVSLNADPDTGYAIFYDGQWTIYGGTSCAAPLWAAFTARINQKRAASKLPALGFANPLLYSIGVGSSYTKNFHDITMGNNLHFAAGKGYDNASGWGSFNGANLYSTLATLTSPPPAPVNPPALVAPPAPVTNLYPSFGLTMTHERPFTRGRIGSYTIAVSNQGNATASGPVTVVIDLPKDLKCSSLSGSGWTFDYNTLTCTQNNPLEAGSSYSPITLVVGVGYRAPRSVTPTATVSGGGTVSSVTVENLTTIR